MKLKIVILALAILVLSAFAYAQIEDVTNFTGVYVRNTTFGTATPAMLVDQAGDTSNNIFELRDAGTPVFRVSNGGGVVLPDGNLTVADYLLLSAQTAISVTDGGVITPTGSYQQLESGGAVTATLAACGTVGRIYVFVNTVAQTIIISDTGNTIMSGNTTLGQYDALAMLCDGTRLIQIAPESDN